MWKKNGMVMAQDVIQMPIIIDFTIFNEMILLNGNIIEQNRSTATAVNVRMELETEMFNTTIRPMQ